MSHGTLEITRLSPLVTAALAFARGAHHGPRREGATDIEHPLEVADLLAEAGFDERVIAAGLLHDVVEDTDTSIEELQEHFGPDVANLVAALTEDEEIVEYAPRKRALRAQAMAAGRDAAAIAVADKLAKARQLGREGKKPSPGKFAHYMRTLDEARTSYPDLPYLGELEAELELL